MSAIWLSWITACSIIMIFNDLETKIKNHALHISLCKAETSVYLFHVEWDTKSVLCYLHLVVLSFDTEYDISLIKKEKKDLLKQRKLSEKALTPGFNLNEETLPINSLSTTVEIIMSLWTPQSFRWLHSMCFTRTKYGLTGCQLWLVTPVCPAIYNPGGGGGVMYLWKSECN